MDTPLLALFHNDTADHHWRVARPFARLAEAGVDAIMHRLQGAEIPFDLVAGRVVVLPRVIVQGDQADADRYVRALHEAGARAVVFDVDDDEVSGARIEHLDSIEALTCVERARLEDEQRWVQQMVRACDGVTVSTDPLAETVRRYTDKPVVTVPNAIDMTWFRERLVFPPAWSEHLTIGWAGYRRPEADLLPMAQAWGRIAERYPEVRFVVAGWQPACVYEHVPFDRIIRVPWTNDIDLYPRGMQVDIGCCSVADTPFSRCKSPIKAWEYTAAGAAVVASRMIYGEQSSRAGPLFVADTPDEWEHAISTYIEYPHLRVIVQWFGLLPAVKLKALMPWEHQRGLARWPAAYEQIMASAGVHV